MIQGPGVSPSASGTSVPNPAIVSLQMASANAFTPRIPLRYLVSPVGLDGRPDPDSNEFIRPGGSIMPARAGKRFIAVKFSVRERDLAGTVADVDKELKAAQEKVGDTTEALFRPPLSLRDGGRIRADERRRGPALADRAGVANRHLLAAVPGVSLVA